MRIRASAETWAALALCLLAATTPACTYSPHVPSAAVACDPGRGPEMVHAGEFCIDSTEVTNRQYLAFLEEADLTKQPPGCAAMNPSFVPLNVEAAWPPAGREDHPVVNVDWCDAASFCQWSG